MNKLFILAETPRAGTLGHRFLVAPKAPYSAEQIAACCDQASKQGVGKDYLAVSQYVQQKMANGAIRQGRELLILRGIQTAKLTEQEQSALQQELKSLFPFLQELVQEKIAWQKTGQQLCLKHRELDLWQQKKMPTLARFRHRQQQRKKILGAVIIILLLGIALFLILQRP